jgi:hypothetical protein
MPLLTAQFTETFWLDSSLAVDNVLTYDLPTALRHQQVCTQIRRRQQASSVGGQPTAMLWVGIDTEWGAGEGPPALLQFAAARRTWLVDIDALNVTDASRASLKLLLRWLFCTSGVQPVGFSFSRDMDKLVLLAPALRGTKGGVEPADSDNHAYQGVLDVQKVAAAFFPQKQNDRGKRRLEMPSLKKVCGQWLFHQMDKQEQCSDWNRRPLSATQVQYAALDAEVLLRLLPAMSNAQL